MPSRSDNLSFLNKPAPLKLLDSSSNFLSGSSIFCISAWIVSASCRCASHLMPAIFLLLSHTYSSASGLSVRTAKINIYNPCIGDEVCFRPASRAVVSFWIKMLFPHEPFYESPYSGRHRLSLYHVVTCSCYFLVNPIETDFVCPRIFI